MTALVVSYLLDLGSCGIKESTVIGWAASTIDAQIESDVTEVWVALYFKDVKQMVNLYSEVAERDIAAMRVRLTHEYIIRRARGAKGAEQSNFEK